MTHHPTAAICVDKLLPHCPKPLTVCELGNQRYTAQKVDPEPESTQAFYEKRGFEYVCIDVNERMGAIPADLNRAIFGEEDDLALYNGTGDICGPGLRRCYYTLVTNNGTSEHIFNQATVFENIHDLCATNGLMLHILPFAPWINHGFYNYNPIFFADLAAANGYEVLFMHLADREGTEVQVDMADLTRDKHPEKLKSVLKAFYAGHFKSDLFICAAFKKLHDKPFQMPMQGKYKKDIEDEHIRKSYKIDVGDGVALNSMSHEEAGINIDDLVSKLMAGPAAKYYRAP